MDPNATLSAIFEAIEANDAETFKASFVALHDWLLKGGFPPTCNTLGTTKVKTANGYRLEPRKIIICENFHIQCINPEMLSEGYEFVVYNQRGGQVARWTLLQSATD
jgi:hypothetical protein